MKVINAEGLIVGRLATQIAKSLLKGDEVAIVNAEKARISGSKEAILADYREMRELTHDMRSGPYFPRMPDQLLKRHIRGMLPYQKPRGRQAFKNLKVYIGVPKELTGHKFESVKLANKTLNCEYMTLGEISKYLGAKF
jgi:large subunit ribosomal protein L13